MDAETAQYLLERQATAGSEWCRVTLCGSLDYAQLITVNGVRRGLGVAYRVIHQHTGQELPIVPEPQATEA